MLRHHLPTDVTTCPSIPRCGNRFRWTRHGFSLIELLVVIAIISLLVALLLPALAQARRSAQLATCMSNVQQLAVGVYARASDDRGHIPSGPAITYPLSPSTTWAQNMSNWIWVIPPLLPQPMHNAHGVLLDGYLRDARAMVCPGTDAPDYYRGELDNYRVLNIDIYSAYLYRQLDQTTNGYIEDLGLNRAGLPARALFVDVNRLGPPDEPPATNHGGDIATVGYIDGHAKQVDNSAGWMTARIEDYLGMPDSLLDRIATILLAMDYSELSDLNTWQPPH